MNARLRALACTCSVTVLLSACAAAPPSRPTRPAAPAPVAATPAEATHALSPGEIREVVLARHDAFRACFMPAGRDAVGGSVDAQWTILPSGEVGDVSTSSSMNHPEIEACVRTQVERLHFPATRGKTSVSFPFTVGASADAAR